MILSPMILSPMILSSKQPVPVERAASRGRNPDRSEAIR